jgi:hypothetical protein
MSMVLKPIQVVFLNDGVITTIEIKSDINEGLKLAKLANTDYFRDGIFQKINELLDNA